jgi:hypothetical protein
MVNGFSACGLGDFSMTTPFDSLPVTRRLMLGGAGSVALAGLGIISFRPVTALAAANDKYPDDAFKQKDGSEAIKLLYGRTAEPSDKIKLDAPEIAENGAVVPVSSRRRCRRNHDNIRGPGKSEPACRLLQDPAGHDAKRRQSSQNGENQQRHRDRGSRRQAFTARPGSQSDDRRLVTA